MLPVLTDDVLVLRAPVSQDRYGSRSQRTRDWDQAASSSYRGHVQPSSSSETEAGRHQVVTAIRVFLPPGTDVLSTDRLSWQGRVYEVQGDPQRWPSPFGGEHHVELTARIVEG